MENTLKQCRISKGLSQMELAHSARVSWALIQAIEEYNIIPQGKKAKKIADVLGVNPQELFPKQQLKKVKVKSVKPVNVKRKPGRPKMNLKNHVQKYRLWKGITQVQLAKATGISLITIRNLETQKSSPNPKTMDVLSSFFGVSYDQLFYKDSAY